MADLRQHQCLAVPAGHHWTFERNGRTVRQTVAGRFAADTMEALHEAAIQGMGIVQLSARNVRDDLVDVRLVEITLADGALPDQGIWAVQPTRRLIPRKVHLFLDALSNHLSGPDRQPGGGRR